MSDDENVEKEIIKSLQKKEKLYKNQQEPIKNINKYNKKNNDMERFKNVE